MIVQVWLNVIVPAQGVHDKEAALCAILFEEQASMLEYLKGQSGRGPVQGNQIHRLVEGVLEERADLQCAREQLFRRQRGLEEHRHIHVAQGMGLLPCGGAKEVGSHQIRPVLQDNA